VTVGIPRNQDFSQKLLHEAPGQDSTRPTRISVRMLRRSTAPRAPDWLLEFAPAMEMELVATDPTVTADGRGAALPFPELREGRGVSD